MSNLTPATKAPVLLLALLLASVPATATLRSVLEPAPRGQHVLRRSEAIAPSSFGNPATAILPRSFGTGDDAGARSSFGILDGAPMPSALPRDRREPSPCTSAAPDAVVAEFVRHFSVAPDDAIPVRPCDTS